MNCIQPFVLIFPVHRLPIKPPLRQGIWHNQTKKPRFMASVTVLNGFRQCSTRGEMTPKIIWIYFYHSFTRHENTSAVILYCERTGNVFETFIDIHEYCVGLCASKCIFLILLNVCTETYCTYCADNKIIGWIKIVYSSAVVHSCLYFYNTTNQMH